MRRFRNRWLAAALALGLFAGDATSRDARACPNCKEAVAAQPSDVASTARGYNWSVMLMLLMPLTLVGTGTFAVVRAARRGVLPEL